MCGAESVNSRAGGGLCAAFYTRKMELHERIRESREQAGLSQTELSRLLGVTRSACSQWESPNGTAPRRERLLELASLLDVSFAWLMTGNGNNKDDTVAAPLNSLTPDQAELLQSYRQLSPRKRLALLAFLRSLVD